MSAKLAKRIRKQIKYNPNDGNERAYEKVNNYGSLEVTAKSSRYQYLETKKEMHK